MLLGQSHQYHSVLLIAGSMLSWCLLNHLSSIHRNQSSRPLHRHGVLFPSWAAAVLVWGTYLYSHIKIGLGSNPEMGVRSSLKLWGHEPLIKLWIVTMWGIFVGFFGVLFTYCGILGLFFKKVCFLIGFWVWIVSFVFSWLSR